MMAEALAQDQAVVREEVWAVVKAVALDQELAQVWVEVVLVAAVVLVAIAVVVDPAAEVSVVPAMV